MSNGDSVGWSATYIDPNDGTTHKTISGSITASCPGRNIITRRVGATSTVTVTIKDACNHHPPVACGGATLTIDGSTYTADGSGVIVLTDFVGGDYLVRVQCGTDIFFTTISISCAATQAIEIDVPCGGCKLLVSVFGCNGLPLIGATVLCSGVYGETDTNGQTLLDGVQPGNQPITITCDRFAEWDDHVMMGDACANSVTTYSATLVPASGYSCVGCGTPIPVSNTLYISDNQYGTGTLTYSGGSWTGNIHTGTYGADACCPAATVQVNFKFDAATCLLNVQVGNKGTKHPKCPGLGNPFTSPGAITLVTSTLATNCSAGLGAFYWEFTGPASPCPAAAMYQYPNTPVWQITE
jgi:hypothetical protein